MRIVVFGGSGQLGSALIQRAGDHEIIAPTRDEADVEDAGSIAHALDDYQPDAVINCTAFNQVDLAESQCEEAFALNTFAVERLAQACLTRDCVFMTISTDYVFDGAKETAYEEGDSTHPLSVYGVSKRAGELLVQRLQMRAFVVRTCGLYGDRVSSSKGYSFIDRILTQAQAQEALRVVTDLVSSPTYAGDLAPALVALLQTRKYGLYHAVNQGSVSWFDFAKEALVQAGLHNEIEAVSDGSMSAPARRPRFSALSNAKLNALEIAMPSWQDGIHSYLQNRTM